MDAQARRIPGEVPASPLRIAPGRLRLWSVGLAILGLVPVVGAPANGWNDWPAFWSGGAMAGSSALLTPASQFAWRAARGEPAAFFPYPPGAAWLFAPLATLPVSAGFVIAGVAMLAAAVAAGFAAAKLYRLTIPIAVLAVLAWAPVMASLVLGQNGPLALLLSLLAIASLAAGRDGVAGALVGLLLYKPTFAAPLLLLLVVRGRWRAVLAALAMAGLWFVASVAATGGDWGWLPAWLGGLVDYQSVDFAGNADKAVSLPGLMLRLGLPWPLIGLVAGALLLVALPDLARRPVAEAGSLACLLGLALSPHAWGYDAALALPAVLWILGAGSAESRPGEPSASRGPATNGGGPMLREPARTRLVVAAYLLAQFGLLSSLTIVNVVAIVVLGLTAVWLTASLGRFARRAQAGS